MKTTPYTHQIIKTKQPVFQLPNSAMGSDGHYTPLVDAGYQRVFIPFTPAELARRHDLIKGRIEVVRKDSLKKMRQEPFALSR